MKASPSANAVLRVIGIAALSCFVKIAAASDLMSIISDPLLTSPDLSKQAPGGEGGTLPECQVALPQAPLTLSTAIDLAICNSPNVRLARADIDAQSAALGLARASYLPTIQGSVSRLRNSISYPGTTDSASYATGTQIYASLNYRLLDFGGRANNLDAANRLLSSAISGQDLAWQQVMGEVIDAYFKATTAKASVRVKNDIVALAQRTAKISENRYLKGAAPRSDMLQTSSALAKARLELARSEGEYNRDLALLLKLIGLPTALHIELGDDVKVVSQDKPEALHYWLDIAGASHPAIRQAAAKLEADIAKIKVVRSEGLPTLDLTAYLSKNGYPNQGLSYISQYSKTVGVSINIPLFDGFSNKYKIRDAEAQADRSRAILSDTTERVQMEVVRVYGDTISSLATVDASRQYADASKEALNSSLRRYEVGIAEVLEVLNAQSMLAEAEQEQLQSMSNYFSNRLRLRSVSGFLIRDDISAIAPNG